MYHFSCPFLSRVLLGSIDEDKDALMDLDSIRAQPLKPVTHH